METWQTKPAQVLRSCVQDWSKAEDQIEAMKNDKQISTRQHLVKDVCNFTPIYTGMPVYPGVRIPALAKPRYKPACF